MALDSDDPEWAEIKRFMFEALEKDRGYASFWDCRLDRAGEERRAANALVNFLVRKGQLAAGDLVQFKPDPPDMLLIGEDGSRVGIEITELVDEEAVARHAFRKRQGLPISHEWAHWTQESTANKLTCIIDEKDSKLKKSIDEFNKLFLAIVTDETMIDEEIATGALKLCHARADVIDRAFLILSYHPQADSSQFPDRCPIFEITLAPS